VKLLDPAYTHIGADAVVAAAAVVVSFAALETNSNLEEVAVAFGELKSYWVAAAFEESTNCSNMQVAEDADAAFGELKPYWVAAAFGELTTCSNRQVAAAFVSYVGQAHFDQKFLLDKNFSCDQPCFGAFILIL
jgi:hypothetical protein